MTDETYESVPLQPIPGQRIKSVLGGQQCDIYVYSRGESLFMDLAVNGQDIGVGMICQNQGDMPVWATAAFRGKLRFFDTVNDSDPVYTGLGSRFVLLYVPEDALAREEEDALAVSDPLANLAPRFVPPTIHTYAGPEDT